MPPRAGPPALSPCPRHNTVRLDSVDRSYSTRSLPLPCSRRQSCEARLEVFLARPGAPVGAIHKCPELKEDRIQKTWPRRLISLKNHAMAIFGLGKNFFL